MSSYRVEIRPFARWLGVIACVVVTACGDGDRGRSEGSSVGGDRPNIVILLADDVGFGDLGCYGGITPTPAIDRLASGGTRFTTAYSTAPNCAPSRAALLTGRYPQRFGFEFNPPWQRSLNDPNVGLSHDEPTLAEALKERGYRTGLVGKWHLGMHPSHHPMRHGFDEFFGFRMGATPYSLAEGDDLKEERIPSLETFRGRHPRDPLMRGEVPVEEGEYLTDAFARESVDFIRRHRGEPFFLLTSFSAIHTPLQATRRYYDRFPDAPDERTRIYQAMVSSLDDAVGRIVQELQALALEEETLVMFVSDNGGADFITDANGALRGGKGTFFEGGVRIPMILRWPGHVPTGATESRMTSILDVAPTALVAAGVPMDRDPLLDGVDLLPRLFDKSAPPPHDVLFWRGGRNLAIRRGNEKLWLVSGRIPWYFDLATNPREEPGRSQPDRAQVEALVGMLREWDATLEAPRWGGREMTTTIDGVSVTLTL